MKMSEVKVGMILRNPNSGAMPMMQVTEITENGFKYKHSPFSVKTADGFGETTGGEHYGIDGQSLYEVVPGPEKTKPHFCPRRGESHFGRTEEELPDDYAADEDACTYCGSLNPETFLARLEAGDIELGATDKSYKVYVKNAGGASFKQTSRDDKQPFYAGHLHPAHNWTTRETNHAKFYFQHLSESQMTRFIELLNEKRIKFEGGFGFYVRPFFIKAA